MFVKWCSQSNSWNQQHAEMRPRWVISWIVDCCCLLFIRANKICVHYPRFSSSTFIFCVHRPRKFLIFPLFLCENITRAYFCSCFACIYQASSFLLYFYVYVTCELYFCVHSSRELYFGVFSTRKLYFYVHSSRELIFASKITRSLFVCVLTTPLVHLDFWFLIVAWIDHGSFYFCVHRSHELYFWRA